MKKRLLIFIISGTLAGLFNILNAQVQYSGSTLNGTYPSAIGYYNQATSSYSLATGYYTTASNTYASTFGLRTSASGSASFASGNNSVASGSASFVTGYYNTAGGSYSFATGRYTAASGTSSFAAGDYTAASAAGAFVFGSGTSSSSKLTNSNSNSFLVGFNGSPVLFAHNPVVSGSTREPRVGIGTTAPQATLDVNGTIKTARLELDGNLKITNNIEFSKPILSFVYEVPGPITDPSDPWEPWNPGEGGIGVLSTISSFTPEEDTSSMMALSGSSTSYHHTLTINEKRVGIGTREPLSQLHVDRGNVRVSQGSLRVDGEELYEDTKIRSPFQIGDNWLFQRGYPENSDMNTHIISSNCIVNLSTMTGITHLRTGYASALVFDKGGKILLRTAPYKAAGQTGAFTDANTVTFTSGGNFGIGTLTPSYKLHVAGNGYITGNLGIGAYNSNYKLHVNGNSYMTGTVGIGTTDTKGFKLGVKGKIACEEVVAAPYLNWSDFVFEADYRLRGLDEVESFIKENKHLPEIPSAREVEKNGVPLAEMNALLLMKVEELTLYIIEQNKRIEALESTIRAK